MLGKKGKYVVLGFSLLGLAGAFSSLMMAGATTAVVANSVINETLTCAGRLGEVKKHNGMTLEYDSSKNIATVQFIKRKGATRMDHGQCVMSGKPWKSTSVGKLCHFGVKDVIYRRNANSVNIISNQAPYLVKVVKGGKFVLKVHSDNNRCPNGFVVDRVIQ